MKARLALVLAFVLLPVLSHAGQKEELVLELMSLTDVEKLFDQVRTQMVQTQEQMMMQIDIPEEHKAGAAELQRKITDMVFSEFSWSSMENDYVEIYTEVYSEEELEAMVEFLKSPAGRSMQQKQPLILQKVLALAQSKAQALIPRIEKITSDFTDSVQGR